MGKSRGRASSSGLAASLLPEAQGAVPVVGFGGYHGASRVEPAAASSASDPDGSVRLPPDVDAEVLQHLRRLGRKDPTTKLKALSTLSMLFAQKPGEEVVQIVPQWAFEYKRLLLDYNRDVRRATNDTMASLVSAVKKGLAPHLKSLMGPWWFSQFDPATEVAQAGRRSFEAAFPQSDRRMDALMLCVKETFLYLNENLKLTTQALSDKVTPMDELEDMHERVISSSLLAMATLIDILLGVKLQSDGGDSMNTESKSHSKVRSATLSSAEAALSMHKYFIDFLRSKSAVIRSATYTLLTSYVKYVPNVFNEEAMKILSSTLLGAFSEKDPLCHSAMWDAVLVFSRRFPEAWSYCNIQKVVLNRFWQFLQNGCYGSKQASYPLIVQFLDSIPPKEVATEQFAFEFLKHLWAGRNQRQLSAADSLAFFTAFKQSFLWFLKSAPRNSAGDSSDYIRNRLITNVLVKMVWQDYLQLSLSKNMDVVPSLLSQEAATDDQQLSHKKSLLAANVRHPIYYYQDLGKCIAEILDDISVTERHLLETACESLLRDYLDIVQQGEKLSKFQDHVNQLISFFRSLDILVVQNGRTWPLENLARPLVERSLPAIKSMDSPSLVELLLVLVEIFGPAPLFLKSSEINDDKSYVELYLSLFDADFVPWCLDGKYSTCSSKIDLLLSLIQEECFFDQWCLIIKHTRAKQKQSVDHKISHTKDQFELLTLILQKVRERIAGGKMKILQRSGSLPEHWRHDLLDSVAVSVFCDLPATDSHVHFLCAALGGSSQDDQICFLSAEAVCKIRGSILKSLASVLITSTFEWTKSSRFLLLPMEHEHSKILGEQSLSANLEIAQLAFQVLERSLFALKTHEEDSVFSHILSALFIIEWECSMALVLAEESDLKGHKEEINVEALMCNTSDDHLDETVHLKANLAERIHAFRQSLIPSFWNDLHSGTLNRLVNILAQSVRAWVAAEMICTWNWKGGSAFSTFLPSLVQYMKTEPGLEVSFVSLLLDTLLEGALMHESSDWALFNSWHLSDSEIEKIQDRFLRSLVALLFTAYTKESVLRESDAHVLFEQLRSSLFIGSAVNRKCLRTLPFVMSTIIKPLTEKVRLNEASPCTDLLGKSILSWLEEAISCLSSSPREVAQQDIEDWMQVVLSCFPLRITGGTSKLIVKFEREISDAETSLLLTLFSRYQIFYGSADPSLSSRETILSKTVELLGVKLTAVMVGYCWTKLGETDWCFVFRILRKWIESSVLLVEEMTDNINDAAVNQTSAQDILEKLKLIACTMEDLTFTFAESALVTLCHLNLVDNLHETDNLPNLQLIRSGEYAESNDKMMENILRLFLASGVSEAIAGSCSEEASSIIASSRVDHLHFWELVASFIIDASPQIRRSALDSMKLWGLTKESVSGLYSILFSSEPISHLQFAAYSLLMSEPLCQLSLVKGSSVGEIGEIPSSSQESEMGQNIESIPDSEKALYLRDELTALIEMPTSELVKTDLVALERHIPLKTAAPSGKKKDVELMPEARAAAEASKGAITTCSLLPYVESLWPVGVLQMASLAGSLYGMMIRLLPSYVRTWFTSLRDRSLSYSIESFTRAWCSPPLLLDEFSQVKESIYVDETFSVSVNRSAYEIIATYKKEETGIDLVIRLPSCYPLRHVDVECTRSLGISEVKCRKWLLSLTSFVRNQNGAIAEAIRTWKSNFDKEFEGIEECPICYSILHTSNHSLPRLACKTCRHKFHGACLYKWFSTSNKSTCPLCQTPF
ncbi:LOW QUALITY PROTEIN: E3 ubiquitin-protein ligase listerin-like [Lolium rigidum]|uniref:LOW QUALITY PROTEIN: E3 ubiquitin-protein ligase listerin-like n=1 Tax=Lolium rigidum TaxID=89674 RepID=UPI001F5D4732|nr:LOW QUALITY PROTEIN: E3 ubiquitin-protein ligase listerin-like [Lolium rigidum]